jgi:hypothetical protein
MMVDRDKMLQLGSQHKQSQHKHEMVTWGAAQRGGYNTNAAAACVTSGNQNNSSLLFPKNEGKPNKTTLQGNSIR